MNKNESEAIVSWFDGYVRSFADGQGELAPMQRIKSDHSRRVAAVMEDLGRAMELSDEDVVTAWALGLLHDVGRFSQFAEYKTINDRRSINHGLRGAEVLEKHQPLRNCPPPERLRIMAGVRHHNAHHVPDDLRNGDLLFVRLIRDADKLDILQTVIRAWESGELRRNPELVFNIDLDGPPTPEAVADLRAGRTVAYTNIRSMADFFVTMLSWVYDINFTAAYRMMVDWKTIEKIHGFLPQDKAVREAASIALDFFNRKLSRRDGS